MSKHEVRVIDAHGYYSEQFLCRQTYVKGASEEILDKMFLAVNLISDLAPKKLQSTVLDASTEASGMATQLKLRGFENVIVVPVHDEHRELLTREFKAEGWKAIFAVVSQREIGTDLGIEKKVDIVTFMDSSFGQFSTSTRQVEALRSCVRHLNKEGVVVLDLSNPIERIRNIAWNPVWTEGETGWLLSRETINPATFEYITTIITVPKDGGAAIEHSEYGVLIPLPMLRDALEEAGLAIREVYGNYERDPYGPDSSRMIVIAAKA